MAVLKDPSPNSRLPPLPLCAAERGLNGDIKAAFARCRESRYLKLVSCSTPTGPRACRRPVAMPISRAKTKFAAVGELRRCIMQHDRRIDLAQEFLRRLPVFGDDRVGVMRAVAFDMRDRLVDAVDHPGGNNGVEVFRAQSASLAGFTRRSTACTAASPRTSQPASMSMAISGLSNLAAPARSTSKVSAAPHSNT